MITIISPAKSQDFSNSERVSNLKTTKPFFENQIANIIKKLKHYEIDEIQKLMKISPKLATEVFQKHNDFNKNRYDSSNSKPAILTFSGDVYKGLDANSLSDSDLEYAHKNLFMLSGLYGIIRSLDIIQAYRLEMGTKISIDDLVLYKYWQKNNSDFINNELSNHKEKYIINLASKEYSQSIDKKAISAKWLDVDFKENKDGKFKTIGIHAKRARGLMARYIIENKIESPELLTSFNSNGYTINKDLSNDEYLCFTR